MVLLLAIHILREDNLLLTITTAPRWAVHITKAHSRLHELRIVDLFNNLQLVVRSYYLARMSFGIAWTTLLALKVLDELGVIVNSATRLVLLCTASILHDTWV